MVDWILWALVAVWEVRPGSFGNVGSVVDHEIITKAGPVIFVHPHHELFLEGLALGFAKRLAQAKDEGFL